VGVLAGPDGHFKFPHIWPVKFPQDVDLLKKRDSLYALARQKNPNRWSGHTLYWNRVAEVHINPDKPECQESSLLTTFWFTSDK